MKINFSSKLMFWLLFLQILFCSFIDSFYLPRYCFYIFNFLDMVSFCSLNTFLIIVYKSLYNNWMSVHFFKKSFYYFFSPSCFFTCFVIFCWKLGILNNIIQQFWKSVLFHSSGIIVVVLVTIFYLWFSSINSVTFDYLLYKIIVVSAWLYYE